MTLNNEKKLILNILINLINIITMIDDKHNKHIHQHDNNRLKEYK